MNRQARRHLQFLLLAAAAALSAPCLHPARADDAPAPVIPFVKQWTAGEGVLRPDHVTISTADARLAGEANQLTESLRSAGLTVADGGVPLHLAIGEVAFPQITSRYGDEIRKQGYRLRIDRSGIHIQARAAAGIFYGTQTLLQHLDRDRGWPCGEALDWPDLAVRGIMLDPARANENASYYERVIRFCGRYKLNRLHLHLSDDQNVCLFHEDYPSVMHAHAWRRDQLAPLVELAALHHLELVPEIESLGHARVFLRHPDARDILHQTTRNKPEGSWSGTTVAGLTNVLCPASTAARTYLHKMITRAAEVFPDAEIHLGMDEVDMTTCGRCVAAFGDQPHEEWYLAHLLRCRKMARRHGRRVAVWGDMLLRHRAIVDRIPTEGTVIYDWHYRPEVSAESVAFFNAKGFEVIVCPALICWPHMILPSADNYANIQRFAAIARDEDVRGMVTTVWIPTRYLSDAVWPGLALAATQGWSGDRFDALAACRGIMRDFFGSPEGDAFARAWGDLNAIAWRLKAFRTGCWYDASTLQAAREAASGELGESARRDLVRLIKLRHDLEQLQRGVSRHHQAWQALRHSVEIHAILREHFLASNQIADGAGAHQPLVEHLYTRCAAARGWVEADWDRNRFADDPQKADLNRTDQHLLDRLRLMQACLGSLREKHVEKD